MHSKILFCKQIVIDFFKKSIYHLFIYIQMSIFGTDGVRGKVNEYPMTPEIAMKIAAIIGHKAYLQQNGGLKKVIVGKDTRKSCYMLESVITAGLLSAGVDVVLTGPVPTPAISMLTKSLRADFGIMISASHNLFEDNGIKIFDHNGIKISDEFQYQIEKLLQMPCEKFYAESSKLGKVKRLDDVIGRYVEFVKSSISREISFKNVKIALDTANGSAYKIAPEILTELGAEVIVVNNEPNGENINHNCGSTHPNIIADLTQKLKCDIGIAVDGDADRLIICDENGNIIDGDYILAAITLSLLGQKALKGDTVVVTIMSNLGLEKFLLSLGISVVRTNVGDRNIIAKMQEIGANLGGEQSGHIILNDYSKTGDGILSAIQILNYLVKNKLKASSITKLFTKVPQVCVNIKLHTNKKINLESGEHFEVISKAKDILKDTGRVIVRRSGTENLIRIMVEGENEELNSKAINLLVAYFNSI